MTSDHDADIESLNQIAEPLARARAAADLLDDAKHRMIRLAGIRAKAIAEARRTMSMAEISRTLKISKQQLNRLMTDKVPHRFDFVVPPNLDILEHYPAGSNVFSSQPTPNPMLNKVRETLESDVRFEFKQAAPIKPDGDEFHRQHLIVWAFPKREEGGLQGARDAIVEEVANIVPGAQLVAVEHSGM
jgi:hypothetical protein